MKCFLKFFVEICVNKNINSCIGVNYINSYFSDKWWDIGYFKCVYQIDYCDRKDQNDK